MQTDAYSWMNLDEDEDIQPPIDEQVYETTQGLMRRGASRSRALHPKKEQVEAMMLLGY